MPGLEHYKEECIYLKGSIHRISYGQTLLAATNCSVETMARPITKNTSQTYHNQLVSLIGRAIVSTLANEPYIKNYIEPPQD